MKSNKIAQVLGLNAETIKYIDIDDQVKKVLKKWLENASDLSNIKDYPQSWYGLHKLLIDSNCKEDALEYFEFLNNCDKRLF